MLNREFQNSFFHKPAPGVRQASSHVLRYFLRRLSDLVAQCHSCTPRSLFDYFVGAGE